MCAARAQAASGLLRAVARSAASAAAPARSSAGTSRRWVAGCYVRSSQPALARTRAVADACLDSVPAACAIPSADISARARRDAAVSSPMMELFIFSCDELEDR
jgi:hypothetical protein